MSVVLVFTGAHGAPGKTVLVLNTALALGSMGSSVAVLETSASRRSVAWHLGLASLHTLGDLARGYCSVRDVMIPLGGGADLLVAGEALDPDDAEAMDRISPVEEFLAEKDFLLVDTSGLPAAESGPVFQSAADVFAVVTPEQVSTGRALWFIHDLSRVEHVRPVHLILNRVRNSEAAETMCCRLEYDFCSILGIPLQCVGLIPEDARIWAAQGCGRPGIIFPNESESFAAAKVLAAGIVRSFESRLVRKSVAAFLHAFLRSLSDWRAFRSLGDLPAHVDFVASDIDCSDRAGSRELTRRFAGTRFVGGSLT